MPSSRHTHVKWRCYSSYKMAAVFKKNEYHCYAVLASADGVHWRETLPCSGPIEDRSSVFLNPMRSPRKWIYSIKAGPPPDAQGPFGRSRNYWESAQLGVGADWGASAPASVQSHTSNATGANLTDPAHTLPLLSPSSQQKEREQQASSPSPQAPFAWTNADVLDPPWGCTTRKGYPAFTQLYNLDAVAYESVIVGFFTIFTGKYCTTGECQPLNGSHPNRSTHECGLPSAPGESVNVVRR